jgi:hypothetical protein
MRADDDDALYELLCRPRTADGYDKRNPLDPSRVFPNAWWMPEGARPSVQNDHRSVADLHTEAAKYFGEVGYLTAQA